MSWLNFPLLSPHQHSVRVLDRPIHVKQNRYTARNTEEIVIERTNAEISEFSRLIIILPQVTKYTSSEVLDFGIQHSGIRILSCFDLWIAEYYPL